MAVLDFIEKLGPGNKRLALSVLNGDPDLRLEEGLIQEMIAKKGPKEDSNIHWTEEVRSEMVMASMNWFKSSS